MSKQAPTKAIGYVKKGAKEIKKTAAEERTHSGGLMEKDSDVNKKAKRAAKK